MSDIYLQITETPTVVTLSQPVVSGALAASVTVSNTVTVALDANSLSALENVTVTVGAAITGTVTVANFPATQPVSIASVTIGNSVTIGSLPAISGTVTANVPLSVDTYTAVTGIRVTGCGTDGGLRVQGIDPSNFNPANLEEGGGIPIFPVNNNPLPISGTVTVGSALPAGTNRIGVVTIGAGTVTIGAGTAQIGSVTASISGTVPVSNSNLSRIVQDTDSSGTFGVPLAYAQLAGGELDYFKEVNQIYGLPIRNDQSSLAISGTVTIGAVSTTVTIANHQGTTVTTSNFTSTTASTQLAAANASRKVLTIFSEGPGNLFICAGGTCTTIAYQVRLSQGEYYEVPLNQTSLTHSAVFATAGTARVTEVS